jgi:hypothetical protein
VRPITSGPKFANLKLLTEDTVQNKFPDFMHSAQEDPGFEDLFSFENMGHPTVPMMRRASGSNGFAMEHRRTMSVPTHSIFDMAPLERNYINLATLNMPLNNHHQDHQLYPNAQRTETMQMNFQGQQPAVLQHPSMYDSMSTVSEESFHELHMPESGTFDLPGSEATPKPLGSKATGISMEDIASYISGPEGPDGKWVCKFPECEKRFGRKENIKSHVQTHLGDRQYRCDVCKKCFVRQHDLKRHSKIHTGIKPYPCACGNTFARHDALTRHRQRGMCIGAFAGAVKKVAKRGRPRKKPLPEVSEGPEGSEGAEGAEDHDLRAGSEGTEGTEGTESADSFESTDNFDSNFLSPLDSDAKSPSSSHSSFSSFGSEVSDPRSPFLDNLDLDNIVATPPSTPGFELYGTPSRSLKEETPDSLPPPLDASDYSPPTSPAQGFYEFTTKLDGNLHLGDNQKRGMNNYGSSSSFEEGLDSDSYVPRDIDLDFTDFGLSRPASKAGHHQQGQQNHQNHQNHQEHDNNHFSGDYNDQDFMFGQDLSMETMNLFSGLVAPGLTALERDPGILQQGCYIKPELLNQGGQSA